MHTHECRGCNARYDETAWHRLALVETQGPDQLRDLFTDWPWSRDMTLEVRRCACGLKVAWLTEPRGRASAERGASRAA